MIMNFWCFRRKLSWEVDDVETAGFKPFFEDNVRMLLQLWANSRHLTLSGKNLH